MDIYQPQEIFDMTNLTLDIDAFEKYIADVGTLVINWEKTPGEQILTPFPINLSSPCI